ncbi:MAG: CoA transferase [Acidimicrobiales bacterium]
MTWLAAFLGSVELAYADALHCERRRSPVGAHPPSAFPSGAIACADGYVTPGSIRAVDWEMQCLLLGRPDLIDDPELADRHHRVAHIDEHTDEVLSELAGYDPARLAALRSAEVIGGELPPPASLGYRF